MSAGRAGRVLVVEDEPTILRMVQKYLDRAGLEVEVCQDGAAAVQTVRDFAPDVLVLDLGLPGVDGLEVCRQVRTFSTCHVLMLTARDDEMDKVIGLSVGADDYMTKPFSARELVARVQARLRRLHHLDPTPAVTGLPDGAENSVVSVGALVVDRPGRRVCVDGAPVEVTKIEFDLLLALLERPGQVLSRRQLVQLIWDTQWIGEEHVVDVHVARLRKKLRDRATAPRFIETVRGIGYRMGQGR
ncbi:response regulator transcription factor [Micrococcus sp. TA1]|uniref:response regulator transcription factor n=1 Tax=Micrococcus sp. TA1 TaxID=681627 RepID=UPI00162084B0|nr:response regulator transcription factor [Micrococcus sp. TA1]MBB5747979.1 DNA-binding response OmpR family regulator [Micrococcus sp. TA1]